MPINIWIGGFFCKWLSARDGKDWFLNPAGKKQE
jgi:hypothetical protein